MKKRILSMLLVVCMVFTLFPSEAFATEVNIPIDTNNIQDSDPLDVCPHVEHDDTCGYIKAVEGVDCTHLNEDDCDFIEAVEGSFCTHTCELCRPVEGNNILPLTDECDCTVPCTNTEDENEIVGAINMDCPVCSVENADLSLCIAPALMMMPRAVEIPLTDSVTALETGKTYTIADAEQLTRLSTLVNGATTKYTDYTVKLLNDITAKDNFIPIGQDASYKNFCGTFDGGGHVVVLNCRNTFGGNQALFGYVYGTVKNVGVTGLVKGGNTGGGVVARNFGTVENCYSTATVSGLEDFGGVVGSNYFIVENCYNTGKISGTNSIGGVVGWNHSAATTMTNCYNTGAVSGTSLVGGVVGNSEKTVTNCVSLGANITRTAGSKTSLGRVSGGGTCTGNKARADMIVIDRIVNSGTADDKHGANVVVGDAQSAVFSGWDSSVWTIPSGNLTINGELPTIKGMTTQSPAPTLPEAAIGALTGTVYITGTLKFGERLTVLYNGNNTGTLTYQWKRGGIDIGTGETYTTVAADIGQTLTCEVVSSVETGTVSDTTDIITKAGAPAAPTSITFAFDGNNANKLMNTTASMEYSLNDGSSYTVCTATSTDLSGSLTNITAAMDIKIRLKTTSTHVEGRAQTIDITEGTAVMDVSTIGCTNNSNNDGKLTGVTAAMEYKLSTSPTWIKGTGKVITGLTDGSFDVRVKATGTVLAGETRTFNVATYIPAPTYSIVLDKTSTHTFTSATVGYGAQNPLTVQVSNTGNEVTGALTVALSGTDMGSFTLSKTNINSIAASGTDTFTVLPNTGLAAGTYTATVTVLAANGNNNVITAQSFDVSFTVTALPAGTHTVAYTLTNLTATGQPTSVADKNTLNTTLTAASGYTLPGSIAVTMGGTGLTAGSDYTYTEATGKVVITNVTGPVVITAAGVSTGEPSVPVTGVTLNKSTMSLYSNTTPKMDTLIAVVAPNNATNKNVTWGSSNTAVATVDTNGVVTAVANGTATITVTTIDNSHSVSCTVTVSTYSSGGSSSGITPPPSDKPSAPTQAEIKIDTKVDSEGSATVTVTNKNITAAIEKAKKNGDQAKDITLVLYVDPGNNAVNTVTVNLPKTVQEKIISNKIANIVVVVNNPDIKIDLDLNAITKINKQAKADASITVTKMDSKKLKGKAKTAIKNRPVFDLEVSYGRGKSVSSFGSKSITVTIPYTLKKGEKAANVCGVYVDAKGKVQWITGSSYDSTAKVLRFSTNHFSTYGVGYK